MPFDKDKARSSKPTPYYQSLSDEMISTPRKKHAPEKPPTRNQGVEAANRVAFAFRTDNTEMAETSLSVANKYFWELRNTGKYTKKEEQEEEEEDERT